MEYNDYELIMLYQEMNEFAQDILFKQYNKIIKYITHEYSTILNKIDIDYKELYSVALNSFENAINTYTDQSNMSFKSYANLIIRRNISKLIRKYTSPKKLALNNTTSIYDLKENELKDNNIKDPLDDLINKESKDELYSNIKNILTKKENEIFILLSNNFTCREICLLLNKDKKEVDNTIARIRRKIKESFKIKE